MCLIQRGFNKLSGLALVLMAVSMLSGCSTDPEIGDQSLMRQAGSAFMEGFLPTRVQLQNAVTYPGYAAGRALAR